MCAYTIKDLERISGIKAHTIRIWESRYNLISPQRTKTNRREYCDSDLKTILKVSQLVNSGKKISWVASLGQAEFDELLLDKTSEREWLDPLKEAMLDYNEKGFSDILNGLINEKGIIDAYTEDIAYFLNTVGLLWLNDYADPAQEHFVSNIIRKKLFKAINSDSTPTTKNSTIVLFLPEGEMHELNLLHLHFVLKTNGYHVIYLGGNIPIIALENCLTKHPQSIAFTYSIIHKSSEFQSLLEQYELLNFDKIHVIDPRLTQAKKQSKVLVYNDLNSALSAI